MMILLEAVLAVIYLLIFAEPLFSISMLGAASSVDLRLRPDRIVVSALDGKLVGVGVFLAVAAGLVAFVALDLAILASSAVTACGLTAAAGCRVRLHVERTSAYCDRVVLWVIPWHRVLIDEPMIWLDGWGDFLDPEALYFGDQSGNLAFEVAWTGRSDETQRMVGLFECALRELRPRSTETLPIG